MLADLKPYPEYKPSHEWIGPAPSHWQVVPGFAAFHEKQVKNTGMAVSDVLSLSYGRIVVKPPEKLHGLVPASFETYQIVEPGDIIIRPTDLQNDWHSIRVGLAKNRGIITSAYMCLKPTALYTPEYLHSLLLSYDMLKFFYGMGSGLRQSLDYKDLKRFPMLVPPPAEQAGIVRFLGAVDWKVNRFIRAKRRLIEVLTEQKQAIITHAVTKGLNPHAPLKPSGIDWLGDVPEHWEVRKLRFLVDTLGGMTPSKADQSFWNGDVPWVSPKDMKSVEIAGSIDHITQAALLQTNITLIPSPAVLIVVRGMILARTFPVGITTLPVTINQDMKALRPRNPPVGVNALYLRHLLSGLGDVVKMLIEESGHGTRVLRTDLWRNLPLPVPSRSEQEAICEYISNQTAVFDQTASQARREIDLIREYRTRLVADVVTGKVDVRAAAVSLPDETPTGADAVQLGEGFDAADDDAEGGADEAEDASVDEVEA